VDDIMRCIDSRCYLASNKMEVLLSRSPRQDSNPGPSEYEAGDAKIYILYNVGVYLISSDHQLYVLLH
jgi:hypothetical protein